MIINPLTLIDFYKSDHRRQYPPKTTEVYSNLTARSSHLANVLPDFDQKVVFVMLQYVIKYLLIDTWNNEFFNRDRDTVVKKYKRRMDTSLGKDAISMEHIIALHDLGYLPIRIKALPEGSRVNIRVPVFTIKNTHPDFFWLTNYLETVLSSLIWKPIVTATTAYEFKRLLTNYAINTGTPLEFVPFQAHDFSFRGMSGIMDSVTSGAAHLTSFLGTDTIPAIDLIEDYYHGDAEKELIGCSVPATEHSVMCMGSKESELATFRRLINDLYPKGIISIVSDTWDFWQVVINFMPILKEEIMAREGKVVLRPDSGDPVHIICGDPMAIKDSPQYKGAVECLWEIFGGTITSKGYKMLDCHIGLIYGDSITLKRAQSILKLLKEKGFASGNIVFGIGSYTYQYVTRDNLGIAMKATSGIRDGERVALFKDPKTDSGIKKSARGLLRVEFAMGEFVLYEDQTEEQETQGALKTVFEDGKLLVEHTWSVIKERINN